MPVISTRRVRVVDIPVGATRSVVFRNSLVRGEVICVHNEGPGRLEITRSVSPNGIQWTILPGVLTIEPGRRAPVSLPDFATFTKLSLTAVVRRVRARLVWHTTLLQ